MATIEQVLKLLRHEQPENRKKAILWLAKSADERAIKGLTWVTANDPDPGLRALAERGIKKLREDIAAVSHIDPFADPAPDPYDEIDDFDDPFSEVNTPVEDSSFSDPSYESYADSSSSDEPQPSIGLGYKVNLLIKEAMDAHLEGRDDIALKKLIDALDNNPEARKDMKALRVAASIMGMDGEKAMAELGNPDQRREWLARVGADSKQKRKASGDSGDVSWGHTWADIGIFGLVNLAGWTILILLGANHFTPLLRELVGSSVYREFLVEAQAEDFITPMLEVMGGAIVGLIFVGFIGAVSSIIGALFQNFIIHFAAVNFFNGKKPFAVTMDRLVNLQSIYTGLTFVVYIGGMFLIPNNLAPYLDGGIEQATATFSLVTGFPLFALQISAPFVMAYVVGRAQQIGFFNGCLSLIVSVVLFFVLYCGCAFIFNAMGLFAAVAGSAAGG